MKIIQDKIQNHNIAYKYISRKLIPKGKLTLDYAVKCLTVDETGKTPKQKLEELMVLKRCARDYFKNEIEAMIIDESQIQEIFCYEEEKKEGHKRLVTNMSSLRATIKHRYSKSFLEKLFQVSIGVFDRQEDWAKKMENDYMQEKGLKYNVQSQSDHAGRDKGCFEILASNVKSEIVKQFQAIGRTTHGYYLTLELPKDRGGKRVQRKKGRWYDDFVKHNDKALNFQINLQDDRSEHYEGQVVETVREFEETKDQDYDSEERNGQQVFDDEVGTKLRKLNDALKMAKYNEQLDREDVDNYMLDGESISSNQSIQDVVRFSHITKPSGEIMFVIDNKLLTHEEAQEIVGKNRLDKYMIENNSVETYGKSARAYKAKALHEKNMKVMKRKRNAIKAKLNRQKKNRRKVRSEDEEKETDDKCETIGKNDASIKIIDHKKTAGGTIYDVDEGGNLGKKTFKELQKEYPREVEMYNKEQEEIGNESDELVVTGILKHKKVKKKYSYLLKFSDGSETYATENEAKIDCEELLLEYKKKMSVSRRKKKRNNVTLVLHSSFKCPNDHSKIESFVAEENRMYFAEGQMLWKVKCNQCSIIISDNEKGKNNFCPTFKQPAFTCGNRTQGCKRSLCGSCAQKLMLSTNNRRKRDNKRM